jgi:hypothetical protein
MTSGQEDLRVLLDLLERLVLDGHRDVGVLVLEDLDGLGPRLAHRRVVVLVVPDGEGVAVAAAPAVAARVAAARRQGERQGEHQGARHDLLALSCHHTSSSSSSSVWVLARRRRGRRCPSRVGV